MQNLIYFANRNARQKTAFGKIMATEDLSQFSGLNTPLTPDRIAEGDYSEIDYVLSVAPASWTLSFAMSASGLDASKSYPFATQMILAGAEAMVVPVMADPAFVAWMVGLWQDVALHLAAKGAIGRVLSIGLGLVGNDPGDGQFHIPGNSAATPVENAAMWSGLGVTHATVPTIMTGYMAAVAKVPGLGAAKFTLPVWCPSNDYIGSAGQHDAGRSYTALELAMQAANPAAYVTPDQTLVGSAERRVIRDVAAGRPYCCLLGNIPLTDTAAIVAAYKIGAAYVAASPFGWVEVEQGMVGIITAALKGGSGFAG